MKIGPTRRVRLLVCVACAAIGVIICVVTMTGIGSTLAFNIVAMTNNTLWMILLVIPFLWPVISELDFGMGQEDLKIWFGILALIVVELGLITPPVGMNVFIISAMARDVPMRETFAGVMPFLLAELLRIALLIGFPSITLFLPHLLR